LIIPLLVMVNSRMKLSLIMTLPTALVLTAFSVNYVTMHFWLAAFTTAITATCWFILASRAGNKR